jgi:hypothetical protein
MDEHEQMTFKEWRAAVDTLLNRKVGLSLEDLPDQRLREAFDDGQTPEEFFDDTLRAELEDLGLRLEIMDIVEEPTLLAMDRQMLDLYGDVSVLEPDELDATEEPF